MQAIEREEPRMGNKYGYIRDSHPVYQQDLSCQLKKEQLYHKVFDREINSEKVFLNALNWLKLI